MTTTLSSTRSPSRDGSRADRSPRREERECYEEEEATIEDGVEAEALPGASEAGGLGEPWEPRVSSDAPYPRPPGAAAPLPTGAIAATAAPPLVVVAGSTVRASEATNDDGAAPSGAGISSSSATTTAASANDALGSAAAAASGPKARSNKAALGLGQQQQPLPSSSSAKPSRAFGRGKGRGFFRIGVTAKKPPHLTTTLLPATAAPRHGGAASVATASDAAAAKRWAVKHKKSSLSSRILLGEPDKRGSTGRRSNGSHPSGRLLDDSSTSLLHDDDEDDNNDNNEIDGDANEENCDNQRQQERGSAATLKSPPSWGQLLLPPSGEDAAKRSTNDATGLVIDPDGPTFALSRRIAPPLSQDYPARPAANVGLRRYNSQPLPATAAAASPFMSSFGSQLALEGQNADEDEVPSFLRPAMRLAARPSSSLSPPPVDMVEKRRASEASPSQQSFGSHTKDRAGSSAASSSFSSFASASYSSLSASVRSTSAGSSSKLGGGGASSDTTTWGDAMGTSTAAAFLTTNCNNERPASATGLPLPRPLPSRPARLSHQRRNSTMTTSTCSSSSTTTTRGWLEGSFSDDRRAPDSDIGVEGEGENDPVAPPPELSRRHVRSSSIGAGLCHTPLPLLARRSDPLISTTANVLRQRAHTFGGVVTGLYSGSENGLLADSLTPPLSMGGSQDDGGHFPRDRKKIRAIRRLPMDDDAGAKCMPIPPFSREQQRQHQNLILQSQKEWRLIESSSPVTIRSVASGGPSAGDGSPPSPARSAISASRKRTVNGESPGSKGGMGTKVRSSLHVLPTELWSQGNAKTDRDVNLFQDDVEGDFGPNDFGQPNEAWNGHFADDEYDACGFSLSTRAREDNDSASLALRPRSRSRVLLPSPPHGCDLPYETSFEPPAFCTVPAASTLFADESHIGADAIPSCGVQDGYPTRPVPVSDALQMRDHVHMDLDSSDEDYDTGGAHRCDLNMSDVNDTSYCETQDAPAPVLFSESRTRSGGASPTGNAAAAGLVQTTQDVLATMPSYKDLKYIILRLREESRSKVKGGSGRVWHLRPGRKWDASRRSAFSSWAIQNLGFTLRPAGPESFMLQVTRTAGTDLLEMLESSFKSHRNHDLEHAFHESDDVLVPAGDSFINEVDADSAPFMDICMSSIKHPSVVAASQSFDGITEDDTAADLASRMESLTVAEPLQLDNASSAATSYGNAAVHPMSMPTDDVLPDYLSPRRMDQSPAAHPSSSKRRPPRLSSIGSRLSQGFAATVNAVVNRSNNGFAAIGTPASFDPMETPLMKNDGDRWGSRPIDGRDWGKSAPCMDPIASVLLNSCQVAFGKSGRRESLAECRESLSAEKTHRLQVPLCLGDEVAKPKKGPRPTAAVSIQTPLVGPNETKRKLDSIAKMRRLSLFHSACPADASEFIQPSGLFRENLGNVGDPLCFDGNVSFTTETELPEAMVLSEATLSRVLSYLSESEMLVRAAPVCAAWADAAALAHANLMFASLGSDDDEDASVDLFDEDDCIDLPVGGQVTNSRAVSMERDWNFLTRVFPWGQYLSEGGMKKVYKVYNATANAIEAVSVTDYDEIVEKSMIGAELAISCLLSSFPRRGICPNFISIHGVFSCPFDPPASRWGSQSNKCPQGNEYDPSRIIRPLKEPSRRGKFQYIRMEFCNCGDVEEFMKPKNNGVLESKVSQGLLFQVAFALHVAAERFSLKHYDMKNLNIMLQRMTLKKKGVGNLVLRYGLGSHFFAVRMPASAPLIAKLADFGTSDIKPESNGKPVTPLQFTTFENTPPDYIILGDLATQGHGHDSFALGLCMLHMFTGETPYEEIMDSVTCPPTLKRLLRCKLEDSNEPGYSVIRSVILLDVCKDDEGNIVEGDPNGTFYDTLYRYLVLFGIPAEKFQRNKCPAVWDAIEAALEGKPVAPHGRKGGGRRLHHHPSKFSSSGKQRHSAPDAQQFAKDRKQFSLAHGKNRLVARARASLERMPGGMDLLLRLCCFDPTQRASALDVLNSRFMEPLREAPQGSSSLPSGHPAAYSPDDTVYTYSAFSTHGN